MPGGIQLPGSLFLTNKWLGDISPISIARPYGECYTVITPFTVGNSSTNTHTHTHKHITQNFRIASEHER